MIKIKIHNDKAVIRWKNPMEKNFMTAQLTMFRDTNEKRGVPITLKDEKGDIIPRIQMKPVNVSGEQKSAVVKIEKKPEIEIKKVESAVVKIEQPKPEENKK